MRTLKIISLCLSIVALVACGGGEGGSGTSGTVALKSRDLDGKYICTGGPYTFGFLASGKCTDNQILQDTCQRTVSISADRYSDYEGATSSALALNTGISQGPDTKAYYYGKTSLGDRLVYERYLPVLRESPKIGVAIKVGSVFETSGVEYSLDGSRNLVVASYGPKPLPRDLVYSKDSGGPGEIEVSSKICLRVQ